MAQQTFENKEQLADVRAKLNANADDAEARLGGIEDTVVDQGVRLPAQAPAPALTSRLMWYDPATYTVVLDTGFGNHRLSIGRENTELVFNDTGAVIPNGSVVYLERGQGGQVYVELASSSTFATSKVLGVATVDIPNGGPGIVTLRGRLDFDTSGFTEDAVLFLSTTPGELTETPAGATVVRVGRALDSAVAGHIRVQPEQGATTFTTLGDTPSDYTDAAGRTVRVNAAGGALEFNGDEFRPEMYGAAGDGVTDDSAAIQAAVDAAQAVSGAVRLYAKTYRHVSTITIAAGNPVAIIGDGPGSVLFCDGDDVCGMLVLADGCVVRNCTIRGNSTGTAGATDTGTAVGDGVKVHAASVTVFQVKFEQIGDPLASPSASCCINGRSAAEDLTVAFCDFSGSSNYSTSGADINIRAARAQIEWNRSILSRHDSFVALSGGTDDNIRHVVANNTATRSNEQARHGVLAVYQNYPCESVVSGNMLSGFFWTGVNVNAGPTEDYGDGKVVVSNNYITSCGGGAEGIDASLNGGIFLNNAHDTTVTGNSVRFSGKTEAGVARATACVGIRLGRSKGVTLSANVVTDSTSAGIAAIAGTGALVQDVSITGNRVARNLGDADILLQTVSDSTAGVQMRSVTVTANDVECGDGTTAAYRFSATNDTTGGVTAEAVRFDSNTANGNGLAASARGFLATVYGMRGCSFEGNTIADYSRGIEALVNGVDRSTPDNCLLRDNTTIDCTYGFFGNGGQNNFVLDHRDVGSTNPIWTGSYEARQIGTDSGGQLLVEVDGTAPPVDGTWIAGDRFRNTAAGDGDPSGWLCTVGGSPGTWVALAPVGVPTFARLDDTPADYTGAAGALAHVNATEDGIDFANITTNGTDLLMPAGGMVGVDVTPATAFHAGGTNPELRLQESPNGYLRVLNGSDIDSRLEHYTLSGTSTLDLSSFPADGTSNAITRLFRYTDSTGFHRFDICVGTGTNTVNNTFIANGGTALQKEAGDLTTGSGTNPADRISHNGALEVDGTGSPEGVVTAPVGSRYYESDTGNVWLKLVGTGSSGWQNEGPLPSIDNTSSYTPEVYQQRIVIARNVLTTSTFSIPLPTTIGGFDVSTLTASQWAVLHAELDISVHNSAGYAVNADCGTVRVRIGWGNGGGSNAPSDSDKVSGLSSWAISSISSAGTPAVRTINFTRTPASAGIIYAVATAQLSLQVHSP